MENHHVYWIDIHYLMVMFDSYDSFEKGNGYRGLDYPIYWGLQSSKNGESLYMHALGGFLKWGSPKIDGLQWKMHL